MRLFQRLAVGHTCDKCGAKNEIGCLKFLNGKPLYFVCHQCQENDFQEVLVNLGVVEDCISTGD